jgi:hypothetical protein
VVACELEMLKASEGWDVPDGGKVASLLQNTVKEETVAAGWVLDCRPWPPYAGLGG